jgi:hypothetical protein
VIRQFRTSLILLVCGIVVLGFSRTTADPDLWGHLRFGLDLLDTGRVIRPDPYSFLTAGVTWVNHEWLAEALLAVAWRAGGAPGIILLKLAITLSIVGVLYAYLLRRGLTVFGASTVLLVNIPLMLPWLGAARPQMFTYLCYAITLVAIGEAEYGNAPLTPTLSPPQAGRGSAQLDPLAPRSGERVRVRGGGVLWWLTPVFLLWANLHGGFLAGIGIVGLWVIARAVQRVAGHGLRAADVWRREAREVWFPVAVAVLATLVTPYAGDLWLFLRTALTSRLEIVEWNPVEAISFEGLAHLVVLVPAVCGWFWSRSERRPALLFLFFVTVLLPLIARRHTPLFAIGLIVLAGEHEADAVSRLFERRSQARETRPADPRAMRIMAAMFVVLAVVCVAASARQFTRILVDREEYPIEAVQLLHTSGVQANLATNFNWGEYVLWHAGPAVKVSIDGRRETVYSDASYEENQRFAFGYGKWDTLIDRPNVDLALVPTQHWPVSNLLRLKPGWIVLYEDDRSAIFARQGSTAATRLSHTPRPPRAADEVAFP